MVWNSTEAVRFTKVQHSDSVIALQNLFASPSRAEPHKLAFLKNKALPSHSFCFTFLGFCKHGMGGPLAGGHTLIPLCYTVSMLIRENDEIDGK